MNNGELTSNRNASEASTATPKASANAEPYCEKYCSLLKRYNAIQKQNYHLMYRTQRVKKLTTRLIKEKRCDDRQFRRIKQELMDLQAHHAVHEYLCRKRKEKCVKTS